MAIKIYEETQRDKVVKKFWKTIGDRFYSDAHIVLVLLVFEVLMLLAYESEVGIYNGMEFWFQLVRLYPLNLILPGGTLIISLVLLFPKAFHIWLDINGIKNKEEAKKPKDKKKYKPNWHYFFLIIAIGFALGSLIYIFLPPANPLILRFLFGSSLPPPTPFDANESVWGYHTNVVLEIALAFGSGFYDEYIFRDQLSKIISPRIKKQVNPTQAKVAIPFGKEIPLVTFGKEGKIYAGVMFLTAFAFALSHYILPFSDPFNMYGFVYRLLFGMIMYVIYRRFSFPIAMWTHVFYDIWYFILA